MAHPLIDANRRITPYIAPSPNWIISFQGQTFHHGAARTFIKKPHSDPVPPGVTASRFALVEAPSPDAISAGLEIVEGPNNTLS